jgi:hypothetical protein
MMQHAPMNKTVHDHETPCHVHYEKMHHITAFENPAPSYMLMTLCGQALIHNQAQSANNSVLHQQFFVCKLAFSKIQ